MAKKPNILLFFTDDQRFDTIAALGNSQIKTPNLDKLVKRGVTFTHAHIPGGTAAAVCMPSRAMLHSGRTLFHIQDMGQEIPRGHATLGETLRGAGYETFGIGKWHNGRSAFARSFTAGDEISFSGMGDHWNVHAYRFDPSGKYEQMHPYVESPATSNTVSYNHCDHITHGKHSTELFVDAAAHFVNNYSGDNPFFMYVSLMAPHDPRTMPEKFLKMYDSAKIELPTIFVEEHAIDTGALRVRDEMLAAFPRDPNEIRRHIAEYYAMITHLDDAFGRLLEVLEEKGELDNTIVVFAGDNGLAVGQHGLMGKQCLYEHSVRVPLIFSGPGIPQGQQCSGLVYLLDIFPTLCDLTGTPIPGSVEGQSLARIFADADAPVRDKLYLAYADSIRGVSDGTHKLIEYACGETQLFDLKNDPWEMNSITDKAPDTVEKLRKSLLAIAKEWDDEKHSTGEAFWGSRTDLK